MAKDPQSIGDILDAIRELADDGDKVSLGDLVEAFGSRSYGPFLLMPALIEMSPIGGIPGVPTVLAAIIVLFAAQMVFGRKHIWLPKFAAKWGVKSERARKAADKMDGIARFLDHWFHGRWPALTGGPFVRVAAVGSILLALSVPPLELLPFASTAPMAAIAAFGLALLVRDGVLMIAAMVLAGVAVAVGIGFIGSGGGGG